SLTSHPDSKQIQTLSPTPDIQRCCYPSNHQSSNTMGFIKSIFMFIIWVVMWAMILGFAATVLGTFSLTAAVVFPTLLPWLIVVFFVGIVAFGSLYAVALTAVCALIGFSVAFAVFLVVVSVAVFNMLRP
ncbi:hypothetical protein QBC34DRAFT_458653, partial [Podospora aff. communis PSN243]